MLNIDKYEKFEVKNWKVGRRFIHVATGEILIFRGASGNPRDFCTMYSFTGKDVLQLDFTDELMCEIENSDNPFKLLESELSLRPLSIGKHNFRITYSGMATTFFCPYMPLTRSIVYCSTTT